MVSCERAFKTLSESHEFQPILLKNGGTVISQSTVNIDFLGDGNIQLWLLINSIHFKAYKFGWSHLKELSKLFQNLMNFNPFYSETAVQWSTKVQYILTFLSDGTIQLWLLITFSLFVAYNCSWFHLKELLKLFQNLMNFNPFHSKTAVQWSPKVL